MLHLPSLFVISPVHVNFTTQQNTPYLDSVLGNKQSSAQMTKNKNTQLSSGKLQLDSIRLPTNHMTYVSLDFRWLLFIHSLLLDVPCVEKVMFIKDLLNDWNFEQIKCIIRHHRNRDSWNYPENRPINMSSFEFFAECNYHALYTPLEDEL